MSDQVKYEYLGGDQFTNAPLHRRQAFVIWLSELRIHTRPDIHSNKYVRWPQMSSQLAAILIRAMNAAVCYLYMCVFNGKGLNHVKTHKKRIVCLCVERERGDEGDRG